MGKFLSWDFFANTSAQSWLRNFTPCSRCCRNNVIHTSQYMKPLHIHKMRIIRCWSR